MNAQGCYLGGVFLSLRSLVPVLTSSRASPLPHWIACEHKFREQLDSNVGAGLLAKGPAQTPQTSGQIKPSCTADCLPS
ncbi:Secreted protein [Pseudomonas sp. IT-93MI4]